MTLEELNRRLLETFALVGQDIVTPKIPSKTLRDALELIIDVPGLEARLFIPHYWAEFLHDGRPGFSAPAGRFLVFYSNPADDPRRTGGRPERASLEPHLTEDQFFGGLEQNRINQEQGRSPHMFVVQSVGPADGTPFFEEGLSGLADAASGEIFRELDTFVQGVIDEKHLFDEGTASFGP